MERLQFFLLFFLNPIAEALCIKWFVFDAKASLNTEKLKQISVTLNQ